MPLAEKVSQLKQGATAGLRVAETWEKIINEHGEAKATEFYKHIGLNHLEKKSFEWEGLTLCREPTEIEKLCIKSIASAQDAGKASVASILSKARTELIDEGLRAIKKLKPADYHTLILTVPDEIHSELRDQVGKVFMKGKHLVDAELNKQANGGKMIIDMRYKQAQPSDDEDSELDDLTDLTDARMSNEVQTRVTSAVTRFTLLGLTGAALWKAVREEINAGSISYIDRAAQGLANRVLNMGRESEFGERADDIDRFEYSAILDANTCDPCAAADGETASSESDLPDTPNPDCAGSDLCRCFKVALLEGSH